MTPADVPTLVALDREAIAEELRRHGALQWNNGWPKCTCGHQYAPRAQGGVSWDEQTAHRAEAIAKLARPVAEVQAEAHGRGAEEALRVAADDYEEFGSDDESVASWLRQRAGAVRSGGAS